MSDEWRWVGADGFEYSGSLERLRHALDSGEVPWNSPVWRAGFEIWLSADSVPELAARVEQNQPLPAFALESRPFAPSPEMKTPPPIGISADHVVVAPPGGQMQVFHPTPAAAYAATEPTDKPKRSALVRALPGAIGGLLVLGALAGLGYFAKSRAAKQASTPVTAPSASGSAQPGASGAAPATASVRCQANRTKPLFKAVNGKIPLIVSPSADQAALSIGFAETKLVAHSITVDSETLAVRATHDERASAPIVGVVPIATDEQRKLVIDLEDPRVRAARTIDAEPPFKVGIGNEGLSKLDAQGKVETLWSGGVGEESTVPRMDGSSALGFFVSLRRGGLGGRVLAGWLGADGKTRSGLVAVTITGTQVGTPTAAVGPSGVVLAAAVRAGEDAAWDVHLGRGEPLKLPGRLTPFSLPRADGVQRMSPAVAALPDGRWALQWTERTSGGHVVRVVVLDADLRPLSEPVTVSPSGSDSGQGELWARQDRLVSLYLVLVPTGHELWGSVVNCQ